MRFLVTGGAGFIGSHFVRKQLGLGHEVVTYDRFSYAARVERLADVLGSPRLKVLWGDLAAPVNDYQARQIGEVDVIVHFAAETMVDQSIKDAYPFVISNFFGMYHLMEYVKGLKNLKRVVCISTDEVYGTIETGLYKEWDRLKPGNPYSATKAGADLLALSYQNTFNLPLSIVRTCNVFGPRQHAEKLIPTATRHAVNGTEATIYGDGKHARAWIYVEDFVDGIDFVVKNGSFGEIYHVGGDNEIENVKLVDKIAVLCGKPYMLKTYVPDAVARPGHDRRYGIDSSKIREMGFVPSVGFEDGLKRTVAFYRENPEWLNPSGQSVAR